MKHIYTLLINSTFSRISVFKLLAGFILVTSFIKQPEVFGEGTKQLEQLAPSNFNGSLGLALYKGGWTSNGQRIPFAIVGCLEKYRLNVYIADPATELIYFGFKQDGFAPLYYQLRDPDGLVVPGFSLTSEPTAGNNGYIASWDEAVAGPMFGTINPSGYKPLVSPTLTKAGNYYLEFAQDAFGDTGLIDGTIIEFIDISVYQGNNVKDGRVWSKAWQFSDQIAGGESPKTDFYILSNDSIVTKLNINRWQGGHFMFYCNQWGAVNTGSWVDDRQSRTAQTQGDWPGDFPEYKVFLNDPDNLVFPTGSFGVLCEDPTSVSYCDGTIDILIKVNKPGTITLNVDVDPAGPGPEDVVLSGAVTGSGDCSATDVIPWDGKDGNNNPVQNGASIHMDIQYINGLTNLPIYDIERNQYGIMVDLVRPAPAGSTKLNIFWDDILLPNCNPVCQELTGCVYNSAADACHKWPGNSQGDMDIYNSWWFYQTNATINLGLNVIRTPETPVRPAGPNPVCQGQVNVTYTVPAVQSAESYIWTLPDGSTVTTPTNTINLDFPTPASGGTLKVRGANVSCGEGLDSPGLLINVSADILPLISGIQSVCAGSTQTYTCPTPGISPPYSWSVPSGGSIISGNGTNTITVNWNITGMHTVQLQTTSVVCGIRTTTLDVTVNPLPVPLINGPASVCVNSTGNVYFTEPGMTVYFWTISAGGVITAGAGTDIITVTWNTTGAQSLSVDYANANSCNAVAATLYPVTVNPLPVPTIIGPTPVCAGSTGNIYSTEVGMTGYTWNISAGGTIISGTGTDAITVTWNIAGPQTLSVNYTNANSCQAATPFVKNITVNPLPVPSVSGPAFVCETSTGNIYSTQPGQSGYLWNVPVGGSITGGQFSPTIAVTWNTAGPQTVSVGYSDANSCFATSSTYPVTVNALPLPVITGPVLACASVPGNVYSTTAGMSNYIWTISLGGTIVSGQGTNSVIVTWDAAGARTLAVIYTNVNSCTAQIPGVINVAVDPFPVADAGPPVAWICSNVTAYPFIGSSASNYLPGTLLWTFSGGDGFLDDPTLLHPTYTTGPIDRITTNRTITFTLTVGGAGNCLGQNTFDNITLLVDPVPLGNAGLDGSICGLNPYQLNGSALYYTIISWNNNGGDGFFSPNNSILNPLYTPGPLDRANGSVDLTMALSGCLNGGDNLQLIVYTEPTAVISGSATICEGTTTPVQVNLTGTLPWSITYIDGVQPTTVTGIISSPYIFNVGPSISTTYTLTALSDLNCPGPPGSFTGAAAINVNPLPDFFTITTFNDGNYCQGDTGVHIGLSDSQANMVYQLLMNGLPSGVPVSGTGNALDFGLFTTPGQFTVQGINPVGNCAAMMNGVVNVIMNPIPVTDFTTNTACLGDSTFFIVTGAYINQISYWHWQFGDGTFATYNAPHPPVHLYPVAGNYTVILSVTDTNGCSYQVSHVITVNPLPQSFFSHSTPACDSSAIHFTDLSVTAMPYIHRWIWDFGDGSPADTINFPADPNPDHIYAGPGTYTVTLTILNSSGCSNSYSSTVTVTALPSAAFTFTTGCAGQPVSFTDNSLFNGGGAITQWFWDFGDPTSGVDNFSTLPSPTHSYATGGPYTVQLIVVNFNGCSDTLSRQVTVLPAPVSGFTMSPGCIGSTTQFWADSVLINVNTISGWQWDFGDGGSDNNRNTGHIYAAPGIYTVRLTITDLSGCLGFRDSLVTIHPLPQAHFDATLSNCKGEDVSFTDLSSISTGYIVRWTWDFGDGSPQVTINFPGVPNVSHQYTTSGNYSVTLLVTGSDSCRNQESQQVSVYPLPLPAFQYAGACQGSAVQFTDQSLPNGGSAITQWSWDFDDPASGSSNQSNQASPSHQFTGTGPYNVQLIVTTNNGCHDSITHSITLSPTPAVAFTSMYRCQQSPVAFTPDAAVMNLNVISQWHWDFGDGNTSTLGSPTHIYNFAGTYTVTLAVTDTAGCSNSISQTVIIVPLPQVNFDYSSPTCNQSTTNFTSLSTTASGYIIRWTWDFGDGNSTVILFPGNANVSHLYASSGTFSVSLTVITSDSCTSQRSRIVTVMPNPIAAFSHGSPCAGTAVSFMDASQSNGGGSLTAWLWDFGDPITGTANSSTLPNPSHTYATAGTYWVKLTVNTANGCSDSDSIQIIIALPPTVDFTSQASCAGDTTTFNSIVVPGATASWSWDFGDGSTSALPNPVHIYTLGGTFTVILSITDMSGCQNTVNHQITIIPGPAVYFSMGLPLCTGHSVTFSDGTVPGPGSTVTSWYWDFGDGHDTTLVVPWAGQIVHTYSAAGTFNVILSVVTSLDCQGEYQHSVTIGTAPAAAFSYENTCEGSTTSFTDQTTTSGGPAVVSWSWDFGDPGSGIFNTSNLTNPTHTYSLAGSYMVTQVVVNAIGCSDTLQLPVIINAKPGVNFTNDSITCQGNSTTFQVDLAATNIGLIQGWDWNFGDGTSHATQQNPSHNYVNSGIYTVTLTVTDTLGCINEIGHQVDVRALPTASFSFSQSCMELPTQFTDQSYAPAGETIISWAWDFGMPVTITTDTSSLQNPAYTYTQAGTYTVNLTVVTLNGCSKSTTIAVQINATPTAHFTYTASPCAGGAVEFQDSSWTYQGVITSWQWEFEPNHYSNLQNPVHVYFNVDSCYTVQLIVTDMRGCKDTVPQLVCVPAVLKAGISYTGVCIGSPMQFAPLLVAPTGDTLLTFAWDFGDPASGTNSSNLRLPAHSYSAVGDYTVTLTATDRFGCLATAYQAVTVNALPVSAFTWQEGICDSTIYFSQHGIGSSGPITRWIWDYGDGTKDTAYSAVFADKQHKYITAGDYIVTLEVSDTNGCTGTFSDSIARGSCLWPAFTNNDTLCQGNIIYFTDQSTGQGPIIQWEWDFGDPGSGANNQSNLSSPSHEYLFPGIYTVKLRISTLVGAMTVSDSTSKTVLIRPSPSAGFDARGTCLGSESAFTNTSNQNGATFGGYSWDFGVPGTTGDTSSITDATYVYPQPGTYLVRLIAMSREGCNDTTEKAVSVFGIPQARFDYSNACKGMPTFLFSHSDSSLATLSHWRWVISDSLGVEGTATGANAKYIFQHTGRYKVVLTVSDTNGCAGNILENIQSLPVPGSAFDYIKDYQGIQGQLKMENQATGALDYQWDFGNGTTSMAENPLVRYQNDSTYTIVLVSWNKYNCPDTARKEYHLLFKGLYVPNAFSPGNPHEQVRLFRPVGVNLVSYHIAVYNSYGNLIWESIKLDAQGSPAEAWDGTYKGNICQQDVYLWRIQAIFRDGTIWEGKDTGDNTDLGDHPFGTVTLIR